MGQFVVWKLESIKSTSEKEFIIEKVIIENDARGQEGHRIQKKMLTMMMLMDSYRHHPSLLPTYPQPL